MPKSKIDKKINIPIDVIPKLLTQSEIRMLKNRWGIVQLLENGLSIRNIAKQVRVGTDTVVRVAKMVRNKKISAQKTKNDLPFKTSTPWIFGKSNE